MKKGVIHSLAAAFADLRSEVQAGRMQYPYSTREAVAVVKHLEQYSTDGVSTALEDVLSFDAFDNVARNQLSNIFHRHGIPVRKNPLEYDEEENGGVERLTVHLAQKQDIGDAKKMSEWVVE